MCSPSRCAEVPLGRGVLAQSEGSQNGHVIQPRVATPGRPLPSTLPSLWSSYHAHFPVSHSASPQLQRCPSLRLTAHSATPPTVFDCWTLPGSPRPPSTPPPGLTRPGSSGTSFHLMSPTFEPGHGCGGSCDLQGPARLQLQQDLLPLSGSSSSPLSFSYPLPTQNCVLSPDPPPCPLPLPRGKPLLSPWSGRCSSLQVAHPPPHTRVAP